MKFAVWGIGKTGKRLFQMLGEEKIIVYIDSNENLHNTIYEGIPVIDYDTYKKEYLNYPILVSPQYYNKEILSMLLKDGIEWAFSCQYPYLYCLIAFLKQAPLDNLIQNYNKNETLYIYGFDPLGILMFDFFAENGYSCKFILQNSIGKNVSKYIAEKTDFTVAPIEEISNDDRVLLAVELEKNDKIYLKNIKPEEYYNLASWDIYYNPKIEKFKNKHGNSRCFIIGTGPSLTVKDLELLHAKKEICFGVNGIVKIFENTSWRPDYYVISDARGLYAWKKEILKYYISAKFISDSAWDFQEEEIDDTMYKWHMDYAFKADGNSPLFSDDFARRSYLGYTIVYDGALQLAAYMGFKEIYLLGVDSCQYAESEKQHFVSNYALEPSYLQIDKIMMSYQSAKQYADSHGIKIYNATRGGALEVFERVDFDSLF